MTVLKTTTGKQCNHLVIVGEPQILAIVMFLSEYQTTKKRHSKVTLSALQDGLEPTTP